MSDTDMILGLLLLAGWLYLIASLGWYAAKAPRDKNKPRIITTALLAFLMGGLIWGIPVYAIGWIAQRHKQKTK